VLQCGVDLRAGHAFKPDQKVIPLGPASRLSNRARTGARVRELDFDLTPVPVSTRTAKGLTVTKWSIKEVKRNDLALK
jgi:hypothetical protein